MKSESEVTQSCLTLRDPASQAPLSMGFSRQEHWSEVPLPSPLTEVKVIQRVRTKISNSIGKNIILVGGRDESES